MKLATHILLGVVLAVCAGCSAIPRAQETPEERASNLVREALNHPEYDYEDVRQDIFDELVSMGPPAVPALIRAIKPSLGDQELYRGVFAALGRIRDPRGVEPMLEIADKTVEEVGCATVDVWWGLNDFGDAAITPCVDMIQKKNHPLRTAAIYFLADVAPKQAVPYLYELTQHTNEGERVCAAWRLTKIGDGRGVEAIISFLRDTNATLAVGVGVVEVLAEIGDLRAVEPITKILQNETHSPWVRNHAARALGELGDKRALEPLLRALTHTNESIRVGAIEALGSLRDTRAWDPLVKIVATGTQEERDETIWSLLRIGGKKTVPLITLDMLHPDTHRYNNNINHLACFSDAWATPLLIGGVGGVNGVKVDAVHALADRMDDIVLAALVNAMRYDEPYDPRPTFVTLMGVKEDQRLAVLSGAAKSRDAALRLSAVEALGEAVGQPAVPVLIEALEDADSGVREVAAKALGHIADSRGVEPLCKKLKDVNKDVREAAVWSLGSMGDSLALQPLIESLKDEVILYEAIRALGQLGDKRAVNTLSPLLHYREYWVPDAAASALVSIDGEEAHNALRKANCSAWVLAEIGDARSVPLILGEVRGLGEGASLPRAGKALGNVRDKQVSQTLIAVLGATNESRKVRVVAAEALGSMGMPDGIGPLRTALADANRNVSETAATALVRLGRVGGYDELSEALVADDRRARVRAAKALSAVDDPAAVPQLLTALRRSGYCGRLAAAKALGHCGDRTACLALRKMLEDKDWALVVAAAESLVRLGDDKGFKVLLDAVAGEDWDKKDLALASLGDLRDARAVEPILAAIRAGRCSVGYADRTLAEIGDPRVLPALIGMRNAAGVPDNSREQQERWQWDGAIREIRYAVYSNHRDSIKARGALLSLVRRERQLFDSVSPKDLESLSVSDCGGGRCRWGPFTFDVRSKTYVYVPKQDADVAWRGEFSIVSFHNSWTAEKPVKRTVAR